jgi:hypothetical protein
MSPVRPPVHLPIHLVVEVAGDAALKRGHWRAENRLTFGTEVALGDLIRLRDASAQVTILCADLSLAVVSGRAFGAVECPEEAPALFYRGERISPLRAGPGANLPRVLSPRATRLLSNRPTFAWQAVPGATYRVRLKRLPDETVWEVSTEASSLPYPGEAPLEPGATYLLEVEARVGDRTYRSSDEGVPGIGFGLLEVERARRVLAQAETVRSLPVSEQARDFALAHLYAGSGLYAEAIALLTAPEDDEMGYDEAAIAHLLGELYEAVKLPLPAEERYRDGLRLAQAANDLEAQARAYLALAALFDGAYNNVSQAADFYALARDRYAALGDAARVADLGRRLAELGAL